jgi:hypothetical protein
MPKPKALENLKTCGGAGALTLYLFLSGVREAYKPLRGVMRLFSRYESENLEDDTSLEHYYHERE